MLKAVSIHGASFALDRAHTQEQAGGRTAPGLVRPGPALRAADPERVLPIWLRLHCVSFDSVLYD
jgi:hypothetical protein